MLKCVENKGIPVCSLTSERTSVGFLRGVTLAILKSEGMQPVVRDEFEEWEKVSRDGLEKVGWDGVEREACQTARPN